LKKAVFLLLVMVFSLLYYGGILTKPDTLPLSRDFFSVETGSGPDRLWDLKKVSPYSPKELEQLYQLKLDQGVRDFPALSLLLIREAEQARKNGNGDQAIEYATYAIKFSPDLPQPYFELSRALWRQSPFQLPQILLQALKGQAARFRHFPSSLGFFYNLFYVLSNAILMAFILFGLVVLAKYFSLYLYEVRKSLTQELTSILINGVKLFILLLPFLFRLDVLWAILFWCILLWGYVNRRERQFIVIFLIVLVYIPFFLRASSAFLNSSSSDIILDMYRANHEEDNASVEHRLRTWLSNRPEDEDVLFTLGLVEKRQGHYPQAEQYYRRATQRSPGFSHAFSNLGNIYLANKQPDLAISAYEQAIRLNPGAGAYYYNLYRAYSQETFLSKKSDLAFQKARQLDPGLVDFYSAIDSPNMNRFVIDETLDTSRLWNRFLNDFIGREGILFRLFKAWFETIPSRIFFLGPILFLGFLIGMSKYSRAKRFLTRCPMCGSPTYRFYLGASDQEYICFNCHRIFIQKEKMHPKMTEKKSLQIQEFQKKSHLIARFLSFFFGGMGDLWRGNVLKGLLFLVLYFVLILRLVYIEGVIPASLLQPSPGFLRIAAWGILFLVFYLFSLRRAYRFKPKYETQGDGSSRSVSKNA
jgi:tetratricopeptide (TPR) repeat protein